MLDWGNLEYFISCANHGTLSGCAKAMGVNHSTVSRKIEPDVCPKTQFLLRSLHLLPS